jgi:hypothetical protein
MTAPACHLELKPDAVPVAIRVSHPVCELLLPRLKTELDSLEKQNIIKKVIEPTAWVHPIVIVLNKDGVDGVLKAEFVYAEISQY